MTDKSNTQAAIDELFKLVEEAPIYFAPQHDFEGRKSAWLARMRAALAAQPTPEPVAQAEDSLRLDHLQNTGSTIDILPGGDKGASWRFRVGGLHAAVSSDIRAAIDAARGVQPAAPSPVALQGRDELESRAVVEAEALEELGKTLSANDVLNTSARVIRELVAARASLPAGGVVEPALYVKHSDFRWLKERSLSPDDTGITAMYPNGFPAWVPENVKNEYLPLYAAPLGRVRMTNEQILDMADGCTAQYHDLLAFGRAIESHFIATPQPSETQGRRQMTEEELVACLVKASCIGKVKMSYESGPYSITRPSLDATRLKDAIEAHHGIPASPQDGGANAAA